MTTPSTDAFTLKAHDRLPVIEASLGFADGFVADLNGATVRFIMRLRSAPLGEPKVKQPAVIIDAGHGRVRYEWAVGDTDTPGIYDAEWEVTYADGRKRTFPTLTYHTVTVLADLDLE